MHGSDSQVLRIERVTPRDEAAALALICGQPSAGEPARQTAILRASPGGLWAASRNGRIVAAMRAETHPGRTAVVAAPHTAPGEPRETARLLFAHVLTMLRNEGVQLAQALLPQEEHPDAQLLAEGELSHVADILCMTSLVSASPPNPPAKNLRLLACAKALDARLAQLIARTYEGSLDMRALDGVRDVDDVLAGYRSAGAFDPARWLLVEDRGADVACLLLSGNAANCADDASWELTYLGVVPEARGRGLGAWLARHGLWLAGTSGVRRMDLAVDAANAPAIRAYSSAGFVLWDRRRVFLRVF